MLLMKHRALAEFLATFFLVLAGTGAIVIDQTVGHPIGHPGVSAVFGLIVFAMIRTFGDVSGAHMNPAVTLALTLAGRLPWRELPAYVIAQTLGACAASLLLRIVFPTSETLGATLPAGSAWQSFTLEFGMTALLMLVILSLSARAGEQGTNRNAGPVIGAVVGLEALFGGPVSGASMNPARSLAPAWISGHLEHVWLYPVATILGALVALPICSSIHGSGCCGKKLPTRPTS